MRRSLLAASLVMFVPLAVAWAVQDADSPSRILRTHSRSPYVHKLTLYDAGGKAIDPADADAPPYSPRATCGKCHAYAEIACGWHFAGSPEFAASQPAAGDGRPGEPWIWTDARSGTQIPLSLRDWPGAFHPDAVGVSPWKFVKRFGRHLAGGGIAEPDAASMKKQPEAARWKISGPLEIDCLICHSADASYDAAERGRQIERENFRWAATAAAGFAIIQGDAKALPDDFDPDSPPPPDRQDLRPPRSVYDRTRFDGDNRVFFDLVSQPPAERCYFCHTARDIAPQEPTRWSPPRDVHVAAGISCTQCHRNGIDHQIARGDAGPLSCEGCHVESGGLGSPEPLHAGLPPLHLEKIACTTCHAGPRPQQQLQLVQTAMAHGLGIGSKERDDDDAPHIRQPLFAASAETRPQLTPHRAVWPSYWGVLRDGRVEPSPLDAVEKAAARALPRAPRGRAAEPITDAQVEAMLAALQAGLPDGTTAVRVHEGAVRTRAAAASQPAAVEPYLWPLAHDVRPARQALGARGCTECHAEDAALFFGASAPGGGPPMHARMNYSAELARVWAGLIAGRDAFKWMAGACVAASALLLLRRGPAAPSARPRGTLIAAGVFGCTALALAATSWIPMRFEGWALALHLGIAPLFLAALLVCAWLWQKCGGGGVRRGLAVFTLLLGAASGGTMLLAMLPLLDTQGLRSAIVWHERLSIAMLATMVATLIAWIGKARSRGA
jgi:Cytochrome c3